MARRGVRLYDSVMNSPVQTIAVGGACMLVLGAAAWLNGCRGSGLSVSKNVIFGDTKLLQKRPDRIIAVLPNRMVVIVAQVPTAPVVSAQVWVKTGSIYEQEHVGAGLSHFLEHLLSGGSTSTTTEVESNTILGSIGAQTNAATSLDTVRYYINTTAEHTPVAIDRLSDWMQNSLISELEYQRERQVIEREFSHGQGNPSRIFWKLTQQARFGDRHPAKHPTIGYIGEFLDVSRDEIYDFYRRMYVPNNMVFVVVGDVDPQKTLRQIAERWARQPTATLPSVELPQETVLARPVTRVSGFADIPRSRLRMIWPGQRLAGEGDYELDLLAVVLGQGESSRLARIVRDEQGLVNSIGAYNSSFHWGKGFFAVQGEIADFPVPLRAEADQTMARIEQVKHAVVEQIQRLCDEPVSRAELARAKRQLLASALQQNQTVSSIASSLAMNVISTGDPDYLMHYAEAVQSLTAADLQAAAGQFLVEDQLIAVELLPLPEGQQIKLPTRPEPVTDPDRVSMVAVDLDNAALIQRMNVSLSSERADQKVVVDPPRRYTLDNGLRLVVQRSTVVPAVSMQMYWLGGLLGDEPGREGVAHAVSRMAMRGTKTRDANQLAEAIEDLGATLITNSGNNTNYCQATSLTEDWPAVMELMADVVLNPTFPDMQWQKMRPRLVATIEAQSATWQGELAEHFRSVYFTGFPWQCTALGNKQVVESLSVENLRAYHVAHLGAVNTVLSVVGDVDPTQVHQTVQRLFAGMPSEPEVAFDPGLPSPPEGQIHRFQTQKALTAVQIGFGPGMTRDDPDYPAMQVLSRVISDFPAGWLEQALRGQGPGLVYAAHGYMVTGVVPGYFSLVFNPSADRFDEALTRAMGVIERTRTEPIGAVDLNRAKAKVLTSEFFSRQSNASRAANTALDWLYGIDDPTGRRFMEQVLDVDALQLQSVALEYLNEPVTVVISSESQ